jgi:hypothetical protein
MRPGLHPLRAVLLATALAIGAVVGSSGAVLAYGKADMPLAQIELSANCNNPGYPLCAPFPDGVGTGGIWTWTEIDAGWTADYTGAGCHHTVGGAGGPGGAGGGPFKGEATWSYTTLESAPPDALFFGTFDPGDSYYLVTYEDGSSWLYPTTPDHYGVKLANGVVLQLTVAP